MSLFPSSKLTRAALLGTVAILSLTSLGAHVLKPAQAQTPAALANVAAPASFADIVERVRGAVVSVKVKMIESADADDETQQNALPHLRPGDPLERFFRQFGGENGMPFGRGQRARPSQALGSGFIISDDGFVVTNNHVVEHATQVTITLDDGRNVAADVVGTDPRTDLALLKIKDKGPFTHVEFARDMPRVGDWVIAVGNPFGLGGTVTAGIVSARGRDIGAGPYDDFLQIDAPVNRGNSGGPTFNARGDVVGVNTAIFSPSGGSVGIGFAIPAEVARNVIDSLRAKGAVARGWIGVHIQPVTQEIAESLGAKDAHGALVADLQSGSPAGAGGIRSGDILLAVNGERVEGPRELARKIASLAPDQQIDLTYLREGKEQHAHVKLGTLPQDNVKRADASGRDTGAERNNLAGLGLRLAPAASVPGAGREGVVVAQIDPDGVGAQTGLQVGDVILEAGGKRVERPADVSSALDHMRKEKRRALLLRVKTGDHLRFVAIAPAA